FLGIVFLGTFVGVVLNVYARQILIPKIRATEGDAFEKYHGMSVKLNGIALVGVAVALVASHL
ncbi:MAG: DUF4149 domain-containing protein, partial [Halobacteria archaeon]|nr:DUF4149 domain-containing protein [Halobacteria archaeon]